MTLSWDWVVVVGGLMLIVGLTYFKPKGRVSWLTEARYYQISISLIGLTLFALASITLGECLILVVLGWMISLRFEE